MKAKPVKRTHKESIRYKVLAASASAFFAFSVAASISGTVAWFTYASKTYVEYEGVSIGEVGKLQIGIRSEHATHVDPSVKALFSFEQTGTIDQGIFWAEGDLSPEMINGVISVDGSATNTICPVTTGSNTGKGARFFESPVPNKNYNVNSDSSWADKDTYVTLPLAFRIQDEDDFETDSYLDDCKIYLTKAELEANERNPESKIHEAVRFHIENENEGFVVNPTSNTNGSDVVGGRLDLNGDGYYDTEKVGNDYRETCYGERSEGASDSDWEYSSGGEALVGEKSTFNAATKEGVYKFKNQHLATASYSGFDDFRLKNKEICISGGEKNYAEVKLTIYVEGWDKNVVDKEKENQFNLSLVFEGEI